MYITVQRNVPNAVHLTHLSEFEKKNGCVRWVEAENSVKQERRVLVEAVKHFSQIRLINAHRHKLIGIKPSRHRLF